MHESRRVMNDFEENARYVALESRSSVDNSDAAAPNSRLAKLASHSGDRDRRRHVGSTGYSGWLAGAQPARTHHGVAPGVRAARPLRTWPAAVRRERQRDRAGRDLR